MKRMKRMIAAAAILTTLLSLCACQKDEADHLSDLSGTTERIPGMIDMESTGQAMSGSFAEEDTDGVVLR